MPPMCISYDDDVHIREEQRKCFLEIQAKLYDDDGEIFVQQHECIAWHSITLYKFHKPPVCSKKQ